MQVRSAIAERWALVQIRFALVSVPDWAVAPLVTIVALALGVTLSVPLIWIQAWVDASGISQPLLYLLLAGPLVLLAHGVGMLLVGDSPPARKPFLRAAIRIVPREARPLLRERLNRIVECRRDAPLTKEEVTDAVRRIIIAAERERRDCARSPGQSPADIAAEQKSILWYDGGD